MTRLSEKYYSNATTIRIKRFSLKFCLEIEISIFNYLEDYSKELKSSSNKIFNIQGGDKTLIQYDYPTTLGCKNVALSFNVA
ncbi:CLUMA_CG000978, isoform A [Clunio marinus]|uniref:CLUMA_CG000978, isoform A n=1 Tax=Clunio marinus TaxID=568069 RepID=A0A1J1HHZ0_9DIPT|nr:CLUMA_CG000978, isoform A [Clunio marinus]